MMDLTPAGTIVSVIDCAFIEAAHRRVAELNALENRPVLPPTADELEGCLKEEIKKCELVKKNWRNRIYRVELPRDQVIVAKQIVVGTLAMAEHQAEQLMELAKLQIPQLRIPEILGFLPHKRTYLMEFAQGRTIEALVWSDQTGAALAAACALAGGILALLERARRDQFGAMPVSRLAQDLAFAPWRLSRHEEKVLATALQRLEGKTFALGPLYYDYKPSNLLLDEDELFLIDPPDEPVRGVMLWDYSLFRSSLRRHMWRFTLRHPTNVSRRRCVPRALALFRREYVTGLGGEPEGFSLATRLFELQRTAVLMTLQQGKINAARRHKTAGGKMAPADEWANRISVPLLNIEKRWLLKQLARELGAADL